MRGSPSPHQSLPFRRGIIPAGAGLTILTAATPSTPRDHPRGCGAHARLSMRSSHRRGSSPRVRGSLAGNTGQSVRTGIIPAGAGLTVLEIIDIVAHRDHPRGCGAHIVRKVARTVRKGSSPRVRGSRLNIAICPHPFGIIPAGAGLTQWEVVLGVYGGDHPRGCGAHKV